MAFFMCSVGTYTYVKNNNNILNNFEFALLLKFIRYIIFNDNQC